MIFCGVCQQDVPEDTIHHCVKSGETLHPSVDVDALTWACPYCGEKLV